MSSKGKKLSVAADILGENIDGVIRKIALHHIHPSETQPRKNTEVNIEKLSKSLEAEGLLQPIVVTKLNNSEYKIIAGERRYRAAKHAGWPDIECKILNKGEEDSYRLAVIENIQRENLDPIEESNAYLKLKNGYDYTDQELSDILGKSRNYVTEILSIANLPEKFKDIAASAGLNSRNLLVQYAQAVKNNKADEFIENFKKGSINTVKSAKSYIKQIKTDKGANTGDSKIKNSQNITQQSKHPYKFEISSKWSSETQIDLHLSIQNIDELSIPLNDLEQLIIDKLKETL